MNQNVVRNGVKPQDLPTQWSNESMFSGRPGAPRIPESPL
jgi:hypothetical protein